MNSTHSRSVCVCQYTILPSDIMAMRKQSQGLQLAGESKKTEMRPKQDHTTHTYTHVHTRTHTQHTHTHTNTHTLTHSLTHSQTFSPTANKGIGARVGDFAIAMT